MAEKIYAPATTLAETEILLIVVSYRIGTVPYRIVDNRIVSYQSVIHLTNKQTAIEISEYGRMNRMKRNQVKWNTKYYYEIL